MATARTINASFLTDFDKKVIELCEKISDTINNTDLQENNDLKKIHDSLLFSYRSMSNAKILPANFYIPLWHSLKETQLNEWNEPIEWEKLSLQEKICNWFDAVELFAMITISYAVSVYKIDFQTTYNHVVDVLKNQTLDKNIVLPSAKFPSEAKDYLLCPLCKTNLSNGLNKFLGKEKIELSLIYLQPLAYNEIKHNSENVRLGHSTCKKMIGSHSVEQTINIFEEILKSQGKNLPALQTDENEVVFLKYEIEKSFQSIGIAIKQYFDYFSEYVKRVKGKEIFFYVKPIPTGFEFRVNQKNVEVVEKYLTEYANLVNEKLEDLILNFENTELPATLRESSTLVLKQQLIGFKNTVELLSFEKKVIERHSKIMEDIIKDLTEVIKEKSKQPIQIFNQSLPISEIKKLVVEIFAELKNTNTALPTEEERILDMYSHLDRFPIQNKPDYQKRINQWLSDNDDLNELSKEYLLSAEFLFDVLFKADTNDYSPFVLQFCRVVENELLKQLFVPFYKNITETKNGTQIKTDYSWDFVKANKNKDFATIFMQPSEPELMLSKMLDYLKRLNDNSFNTSVLLSEFKTFMSQYFDTSIILSSNFINKIDFIRENYRNKAAHPDRNTIKLNLSEAQKCQSLVREILILWLESKR